MKDSAAGGDMRKFFISYTSKDSQKAKWIGWTLKDLGHEANVHEWEIGALGPMILAEHTQWS